jgi:CubicO group peptidase (beta-lactamase class C family)
MILQRLLTLFIVASAISSSHAAPLETLAPKIREQLSELSDAQSAAGLGIAIISDGKIVYQETAGFAQKGSTTPFQSDSSIPIGSASRLFLGLLAQRLHAEGKLDWKKPAAQVLPMRFQSQLPANTIQPILVEDFVSYSTGITRGSLNNLFGAKPSSAFALPAAIQLIRPAGAFSESSFYSDELFALVLAQAAGGSYAGALQSYVLDPLNLKHTYLGYKQSEAREHHEGKLAPIQYTPYAASLSARSSLLDLSNIMVQLQSGTAFDAQTKAQLSQAQARRLEYDFSEAGTGQGLMFAFSESNRAAVGLVGYLDSRFDGHTVSIRYIPKHQLAVVLMANYSTDDSDLSNFSRDVLDETLLAKAGIAKRNKEEIRKPKANLPLPAGFIAANMEAAYATPAGALIPEIDGDQFDFELAGFNLRAIKRADGWYQLRYRLLGFIPLNLSFIENILIAPVAHQKRNGEVQKLLLYAAGSDIGLFGSALPEVKELNTAQRTWIGEYRVQNPDRLSDAAKVSDIEVREIDGRLMLCATFDRFINVEWMMPLTVDDSNRASLAGFGPGLGESITRDAAGTLNFAGYLLARE